MRGVGVVGLLGVVQWSCGGTKVLLGYKCQANLLHLSVLARAGCVQACVSGPRNLLCISIRALDRCGVAEGDGCSAGVTDYDQAAKAASASSAVLQDCRPTLQ